MALKLHRKVKPEIEILHWRRLASIAHWSRLTGWISASEGGFPSRFHWLNPVFVACDPAFHSYGRPGQRLPGKYG